MKHQVSFELELKKHNFPGTFIAIEGIDGSGKTTLTKNVVEKLNQEGVKAVYTKEPTQGVIGELIRKILNFELNIPPISLQYLFCADRAVHQKPIENYLNEGYVVVSDRYFWSAVAYGIADMGGSQDFYLTAFSILSFYNRFLNPDHTFFLGANIDEAAKRIAQSHKHREIYDDREKLERIDIAYRKLIERFKDEFTIIDANRPFGEVSRELFEQAQSKLK